MAIYRQSTDDSRAVSRNTAGGLCIKVGVHARKPTLQLIRALILGGPLLWWAISTPGTGAPIPHGTLELVAENQWIAEGHEFDLGLHFQLEKGWHIYWVNPGDSGERPHVIWQLPTGITAGEIEWPTPRRLGSSSVVDFGYEDTVMLIVPMHAEAGTTGAREAQLSAEVGVLVCREMCIPGKAHVLLTLPIKLQSAAPDPGTSELFATTRKSLPRRPPANWKFRVDDARDLFVLSAKLGQEISQAMFFPLHESQVDNAARQELVPEPAGFRLTLRKSDQLLRPVERLEGVLVLPANRAYLIDVPVRVPSTMNNYYGPVMRPARFREEGQLR